MSQVPHVPGPPPPEHPPYAPVTPAKKKPRTLLIMLSAVTGVLALCVGSAVAVGLSGDSGKTPEAAGTETKAAQPAAVTTTTAAPPPPVVPPKPADFKLGVKILEKRCFGSAGCNVTFRIDVVGAYSGPTQPADKKYEVVYQINGGEEPQINRFTMEGDSATYEQEERISTKNSKAVLTAVVIEVNEM